MMKNKEEIKKLDEEHNEYTFGVIERSMNFEKMDFEQLNILCEYLYVQSFIHGYKHGVDENG